MQTQLRQQRLESLLERAGTQLAARFAENNQFSDEAKRSAEITRAAAPLKTALSSLSDSEFAVAADALEQGTASGNLAFKIYKAILRLRKPDAALELGMSEHKSKYPVADYIRELYVKNPQSARKLQTAKVSAFSADMSEVEDGEPVIIPHISYLRENLPHVLEERKGIDAAEAEEATQNILQILELPLGRISEWGDKALPEAEALYLACLVYDAQQKQVPGKPLEIPLHNGRTLPLEEFVKSYIEGIVVERTQEEGNATNPILDEKAQGVNPVKAATAFLTMSIGAAVLGYDPKPVEAEGASPGAGQQLSPKMAMAVKSIGMGALLVGALVGFSMIRGGNFSAGWKEAGNPLQKLLNAVRTGFNVSPAIGG